MNAKKRKLKAYLIGAMEAAENLGAGWREDITPFLESLGFDVLNPCEFEPEQLKDLRPNRLPKFYTDLSGKKVKPKHWHDLKNASEPHLYDRFVRYMRRIIRYDINIVRKEMDIGIVFWDKAAGLGAGSHAEMTEAFMLDKPVYCIAKSDVPAWLKACCTDIVLSFDDLKTRLTEDFGED